MSNDETEITLAELQLQTKAVTSQLQAQLEQRQNQIILAAAALIAAAAIGYWLGHQQK